MMMMMMMMMIAWVIGARGGLQFAVPKSREMHDPLITLIFAIISPIFAVITPIFAAPPDCPRSAPSAIRRCANGYTFTFRF